MIDRTAATDNANRLVGRFLQHFGLLEAAVDDAIRRLTGLQWSVAAALAANMPFVKKVEFTFLAEAQLSEKPDVDRARMLKATKSSALWLNDRRVIAAHCSFDANDDGSITFHRTIAKESLKVSDIIWSEAEVEQACAKALETVASIAKLVEEMMPFREKLDFSDQRNSMYAALLF